MGDTDEVSFAVTGSGLWFTHEDYLYRLDDPYGLPKMSDRDRAVARALAALAIERIDQNTPVDELRVRDVRA